MTLLRATLRFLGFLLTQAVFIALAGLLCLILPFGKKWRWRLAAYWGRVWARTCCTVLNIRIRQEGVGLSKGPVLMVSNHIGMPDVFVMGSLFPGFFVAKLDVRKWPLVGWMAGVGGAVFVDRDRRQSTGGLVDQMVVRLEEGITVHLFPEGGAMDGSAIAPFKTPPFEAALRAEVPVQPVVLEYHDNNKPSVACWHEITFTRHLLNILKAPRLEVTACILPTVSGFEKRRELAEEVRKSMISSEQ
ncbi:MAG: 1-acyl-sn-glycerol-3-phosphate acyltransferase [Candidatus Nitronauta litoralis]|uniref:1-acyl-sn-glycerol-3-phosphate acyltransferase n=1 Tax=Candidatus Nitronauta litoralis TaxID=2705533 RepID=A0A7T0BWA4_9BACT|nr:MAG: 1-acyl-sn-glycerol-3-phosphate acyltransferase [Candidatus Nitronauta litoralis]